jgi:pimeloyl-ACP methyl ester carboxylesterase
LRDDKALRSGERSFGSALLDLWDDVAKIRCPPLVLKGAESDILSGKGAEKLRAAIAGSQLAVIPGAGHSVMGDNPQAFLAALRAFLATLPS